MTCSLLCVGHAVLQAVALPFGQQSGPPNSLLCVTMAWAVQQCGLNSVLVILLPRIINALCVLVKSFEESSRAFTAGFNGYKFRGQRRQCLLMRNKLFYSIVLFCGLIHTKVSAQGFPAWSYFFCQLFQGFHRLQQVSMAVSKTVSSHVKQVIVQ